VYKNNVLQFFGHEEGRVRPLPGNTAVPYAFDYMLKDHLGNVRAVITDEQKVDQYPVATLEDGAGLAIEKNYYDITDANIVSRTAAFNAASGSSYPNNNGNPPYNPNPGSTTAAESQKLYKLNGSTGSQTGLGITLKVMAGDEVFIYGKSFYHLNAAQTPNNTFGIIVNNLLGLFAGTNAVAGAGKGATAAALTSSPTIPAATQNILNNTPATAAGQPKAYINWILFNEQFQPVLSGSSADRVGVAEEIKSHQQQVQIGTSGYLYVYCSNESDVDVFFDNLQLVHQRGLYWRKRIIIRSGECYII
jgi:hypothetical protein